jgi:hypothetical protein
MTTTHSKEIHSEFKGSFDLVSRPDHSGKVSETIKVSPADHVADILFERLEYFLQYCDEEHDRLSRVTAILLEAFH